MRFKHALAAGLVLSLPLVMAAPALPGEILGRLFHWHADCPADQTVVRVPAQEIRVETTRPRVVVNEVAAGPRLRHGAVMAGYPMPLMYAQPYVATIYAPMALALPAPPNNGGALRAVHDLEAQALEVAKQRAAYQAEMATLNQVHKRIMANLGASSLAADPVPADTNQLKTAIDNLTKRVSDVERLLIIHDNAIKDKLK
jgi:hypothetical protein